MKQFILKIIVFALFILISVLGVFSLADGSTDAMYLRFTTPKQKSMVVGASRAAQGIQPNKVNHILNRNDLYNYAFQGPSSPYGEIYLASVKRKLDTTSTNGLFVLEVNPWVIGLNKRNTGEEYLTEEDGFLFNTKYVNLNPNIEYLIESLDKKNAHIIRNRYRKGEDLTYFIENDGWLHVTLKSDSISKINRTVAKIKQYKDKLLGYHGVSAYRKTSLLKTIQFLQLYGEVYLVRMPISEEVLKIENEILPNFNKLMTTISINNELNYINMMPHRMDYEFTDGNHLDANSSLKFSVDLANEIKGLQNQK